MTQRRLSLPVRITLLQAVALSVACSGSFEGAPSGPGSGSSGDRDTDVHTANGDAPADADGPASDPGAPAALPGDPGGGGADPGVPVVGGRGLPCEVATLLSTYCTACHATAPIGGAHVPLLDLDDLTAASPSSSGASIAEDALARLRSASATRMPPAGTRPGADEVAAFAAWVTAGMPAEDCGALGDAGIAQPDPTFSGEVVCTSDSFWTFGDSESPLMHPGYACIDCHSSEGEGPSFSLAGSVFATGHEPDDCNGASGGIQIEVTDASGKVVTMTPNSAGNFFSSAGVTFPITARVLFGGRERRMVSPVASGDCNGCHTTEGRENAPGRVALP